MAGSPAAMKLVLPATSALPFLLAQNNLAASDWSLEQTTRQLRQASPRLESSQAMAGQSTDNSHQVT